MVEIRTAEIRTARTTAEIDRAIDLAEDVWGARPVSQPVLRALELAGCYVSTAHLDGDLVGMCAAFPGVHDDGWHLHSHLAAVVPEARGHGIGRALKRHQRDWCLERGIQVVTWTFDPLIVENARFNLHHLGARGDGYLIDLYGPVDDAINQGHPTDRLLVRWELEAAPTLAALDAPLATPAAARLLERGAVDVVAVEGDDVTVRPSDARVRLVDTPERIVDLRGADPTAARRWRTALREAMTAAFADGLSPTAITDDHRYVFEARP